MGAEKGAKGFTCYQQFVAMLSQIRRAHYLREICGGLASSLGKIRYLGIKGAPKHDIILCKGK